MEFKFQIKGNVYSLTIGHVTKWYECSYFIMLSQEWYGNNRQVDYARSLFQLFPDKEHRQWLKEQRINQ
jgi:hypothetical protein